MPSSMKRPLNILLAIDGSEHALAAVNLLCDLPLLPESSITALAVSDVPSSPRKASLQAALAGTETLLKDKGFSVRSGLLQGNPAAALAEYADEHKPDLIVLGARGLRSTLGILLGGVAQQVVEYARFPTLVVRAPYNGLRCVLLVTDGSEQSRRAGDYLAGWPLPQDAEVMVINVLPPLTLPDLPLQVWPTTPEAIIPISPPLEELTAWQDEEQKRGQVLVDQVAKRLEEAGVKTKSTLLRGDAATEIIEYARVNEADLIVAGSRGLSQVKGWLLGSVSRKLVHYAGCSVLLVK